MKTKTEGSDNIQSIQLLRGIAAFLVLLVHSAGAEYLPETSLFRQVSSYGWMGVEIFFIISGFIIPYSMFKNRYVVSDFGSLMVRRLVRIEPPYLLSLALLLLLYYSSYISPWRTSAQAVAPIDWGNVLGHIAYINAFTHQPWLNIVYWTLAIEFEYYIIMGVFFQLITHRNISVRLLTHFGLLATSFLTPLLHINPIHNIHSDHILYFFPFFLMGIALFLYRCQIIDIKELLVMIAIDAAICLKDHGIVLVCVSIASLLAIQYIRKVPKAFLWLGTISYSLYLTHALVVSRVIALSGRFTGGRYIGLRMILCIGVCVVAAWLYYVAVEKPFIRLSKKIKYIHLSRSKSLQETKQESVHSMEEEMNIGK